MTLLRTAERAVNGLSPSPAEMVASRLSATCATAHPQRRRGGAGRRHHDSPHKARRAAGPCALDNSRGGTAPGYRDRSDSARRQGQPTRGFRLRRIRSYALSQGVRRRKRRVKGFGGAPVTLPPIRAPRRIVGHPRSVTARIEEPSRTAEQLQSVSEGQLKRQRRAVSRHWSRIAAMGLPRGRD